jgi:hypothetical protein
LQFLRFVAGPIAAGMLMLAPATMSVFAQAAPAPATAEDQAYQMAYTAALSDVSALLAEKTNMDTRLASVDATTDFPVLVADIGALGVRWQAVTDKLVLLQPTDRYVSGHLNSAIAIQTFAVSYAALATAITANDVTGIAAAVATLSSANSMLVAAGAELMAA